MKVGIFNRIFRNFGYKVASLFLAVVVWGMIQGEQVLEVNREIFLDIKVPEGYMVRDDVPRAKAATVKGPRVLMLEAPSSLEATIRIPEGTVGRYRTRIERSEIRGINERLQLTIPDPYVTLWVDEKISRTVPIKEVLQGAPAEGYIIKDVTLKPRTVNLTGLKGDLLRVRQVVTEPIDISGLQENKSFEVALIAPPGLAPDGMSADKVAVNLQLGDSKVNKRFGSIPIEVVGSDYGTTVRPNYVSIVIQGTPGVLSFVKRSDLKAFVEARELKPGRYELDVKVKIPPETALIETFPEKAIVTIGNKAK